ARRSPAREFCRPRFHLSPLAPPLPRWANASSAAEVLRAPQISGDEPPRADLPGAGPPARRCQTRAARNAGTAGDRADHGRVAATGDAARPHQCARTYSRLSETAHHAGGEIRAGRSDRTIPHRRRAADRAADAAETFFPALPGCVYRTAGIHAALSAYAGTAQRHLRRKTHDCPDVVSQRS